MFEWDEAKNDANRRVRGFDFAYATKVFKGPTLEVEDRRREYGERRVTAIGRVGPETFMVVYTWRGHTRRIISARLASRKEREVYGQIFGSKGSR